MAPEVALAAEPEIAEDVMGAARARNEAAGFTGNPSKAHRTHGATLGAKVRAARSQGGGQAALDEYHNMQDAEREGKRSGQRGGSFRPKGIGNVSLPNVDAVGTSSGRNSIVIRLIVALGVALVALEVASYVSGRYFSWDLKSGANRIQDAGTMIGFYPGQQAALQAAVAQAKGVPAAVPPPVSAVPYVGHSGGFV